MNARRRSERVAGLIDALDPDRAYDRPFLQVIAGIYNGSVIIEESRPGDPPVLSDSNGRLLRGSGQRSGSPSPRTLGLHSWNYPKPYIERNARLHEILDHGSDRERYALIKGVLG